MSPKDDDCFGGWRLKGVVEFDLLLYEFLMKKSLRMKLHEPKRIFPENPEAQV